MAHKRPNGALVGVRTSGESSVYECTYVFDISSTIRAKDPALELSITRYVSKRVLRLC